MEDRGDDAGTDDKRQRCHSKNENELVASVQDDNKEKKLAITLFTSLKYFNNTSRTDNGNDGSAKKWELLQKETDCIDAYKASYLMA